MMLIVFFFKQKTAYEMRISDWSSDVCSSDLYYFRRSSPFVSCNVLGTPRKTAGAGLSDERQGKSCAPPDAHFCHRIVIETGLKAEITHLHRCSREAFAGPADGSSRCFPPQRSRPAMPRRRPADTGAASMRACRSDERRDGTGGVSTWRSRWGA